MKPSRTPSPNRTSRRFRSAKGKYGSNGKPADHLVEVLEGRIAPAYASTIVGAVASFVGDAASDSLVITESGGFLMHNHGADTGFNSAFDFDSTVAGDQMLIANPISIINVNGGGGTDSFSENRSTDFQAGALTLTGDISLTTTGSGARISVNAAISAGSATITADALDILQPLSAGGGRLTLQKFGAGSINLGMNDGPGVLGLTDLELSQITADVLQIGADATSSPIQIGAPITRHAGFSTLTLLGDGVTQVAPLSVANLAISTANQISLTNPANDVDNLAANADNVGAGIAYTDVNSLTTTKVDGLTGVATAAGNVSLVTGGSLTISKYVSAAGNSILTLNAAGPVTQAADALGSISGTSVLLLGAGPFTLTNPQNIVFRLAANTSGSIDFVSTAPLIVDTILGTNGVVSNDHPISIATVDGNLTVNDTRAGADVDAGASTVALTAGGAPGDDNTLTLNANAGVSGTGGVTFTADHMVIGAAVNAGANTAVLRPFEAGTLIDLGGADAANTLGLDPAELNQVTAGVLRIGGSSSGNLSISSAIAPTGSNQLELITGAAILDANNLGTDITVSRLGMTAHSGIGTDGTTTDAIEIQVSNLEAMTDLGGIEISNVSGDVTIGGVNPSLHGLTVNTSGVLRFTNAAGSIFLADNDGLETVRGGSQSGDIFLTASGATSDVQSTINIDAIIAPHGNITVAADRDVLFGTAGSDFDNDVRAFGSVTLTAGRNIIIDGFSDVASDDFGNNTGAGVSLTTESGDITISNVHGNDASVGASGTGAVSLLAGSLTGGHLFTNQGSLFANGGNIAVRADNFDLQAGSSISAPNAEVNLRVDTAGTGLDLGSTASGFAFSQTELNTISAKSLRLTASADVNVSQSVSLTGHASTLVIEAGFGQIIDGTAGEQTDITVANLAITSLNGIGAADDLDVSVSKLAFTNTTGAVNISNAGALQIDAVTGVLTSANLGTGATTISAASPVTFAVSTSSGGTLTVNAIETVAPTPGVDNITVNTGVTVQSTGGDVNLLAGDNIVLQNGSLVSAPTGYIDLRTGFGDNDNEGVMTLDGGISAPLHSVALNVNSANTALPAGTPVVTQASSGSIVADGLLLIELVPGLSGGFALTNSTANQVGTIAGSTNSPVSFRDSIPLNVGVVSSPNEAFASVGLITNNHDVVLLADEITVSFDLAAGSGIATLAPSTSGRGIDLGTKTPGSLGLTQTDLNNVTASILRIGDLNLTGNITISAPIHAPTGAPGTWNTLSLLTGVSGGISQNAGAPLTVPNLFAGGATGVALNDAGNAVSLLAGASLGAFSLVDSTSLTVGTVDSTLGGGFGKGILGGGPITLSLISAASQLTVAQPINATFFGGASHDITLTADDMAINAAVQAGSGTVALAPATFGRQINLGTNAAGSLGLTDAELDQITAAHLIIGDFNSGNIVVSAPVSPASDPVLSLFTGGSITASGGGSLAVTELALHATAGIGTAGTPLATIVQDLAFSNAGGIVSIANTGTLTINAVDDLPTSANDGTTTTLRATAGLGATPGGIVFAVNTLSHGTLTATAVESAQPQDDIRVNDLVELTSETGDVILNAGDGIIAEENSAITAKNEVKLTFGFNDLDGISFIDLRGFITGRLLTLQGSTGHESITLGNLDKIDVQIVNIRTGADNVADSVTLLDNALSHEISASLRLGGYVSVLGFRSEIRIFETTTLDTLTIGGREGNDTITAEPGVESKVKVVLDGGSGDDVLTGNGTLVGGEGNDVLNGSSSNDVLLGDGGAQFLYGLTTGNELAQFSSEAPDTLLSSIPVTGLTGGDTLVGIDARPSDGKLYALGVNAGVGHLYTIDPLTGAATLVATLAADPADLTNPFTGLSGSEFGVDFNPVADRLRVVSNTGQNLRINVDTGLVTTDTDLNPGTPMVVGAAYANNYVGAASTILYTVDAGTDQLLIQNPPNNGTLTVVGGLGVDADAVLGFDIVPGTNQGYAALVVGGVSGLYSVDLVNGVATFVAAFGGGSTIRGLAVGATRGNDVINGGAGDDILVGGSGNNQLFAGAGNDRLETADGDDLLDGGDGNDVINAGPGNDILIGGLGSDTLNGGGGIDILRETRDADFVLTNTALKIGSDPSEALTGIEKVELTGGAGANLFNVGAFTGGLKITGGEGSDTLDFSASTLGVSIDLDDVNAIQALNTTGVKLLLGDAIENFTGSALNDVIFAKAQSFTRTIDGGAPSVLPGAANAPIPPGDHLTVDGRAQFVSIIKTNNAGTVKTPGFGTITFTDVETVDASNSSATGGFTGGNGGTGAFAASVLYKVGGSPVQTAVGDLNGDGFDDIVTANRSTKTVSVLLSRGDGTFDPAVNYKTVVAPISIALGNVDDDLNAAGGDSDLDIIVGQNNGTGVAVLLNDGAGHFGTPTIFRTKALAVSSVKVADFNEDGLLDVATLHKATGQVSLFLNNGAGVPGVVSFAKVQTLGSGGIATDFGIGNFDGDAAGHLDIVVAQSKGFLRVLTGDGTGAFALQSTNYDIGVNPTVIALADFNNDGKIDVAVNHTIQHYVSVLLGRGNLGGPLFEQAQQTSFGFANFHTARSMTAADFDGDGNVDLAFSSDSNTVLHIALGLGTSSFQRPLSLVVAAPVTGPTVGSTGVVIGDFNGDGANDIVLSNNATPYISIIFRTPTV